MERHRHADISSVRQDFVGTVTTHLTQLRCACMTKIFFSLVTNPFPSPFHRNRQEVLLERFLDYPKPLFVPYSCSVAECIRRERVR